MTMNPFRRFRVARHAEGHTHEHPRRRGFSKREDVMIIWQQPAMTSPSERLLLDLLNRESRQAQEATKALLANQRPRRWRRDQWDDLFVTLAIIGGAILFTVLVFAALGDVRFIY
jgi:hypothetical protein